MIREEAYRFANAEKCTEDGDGYRFVVSLADHLETIDKIYDDEDEKVCSNCRFSDFSSTGSDFIKCSKLSNEIYLKTFGCNEFRKFKK